MISVLYSLDMGKQGKHLGPTFRHVHQGIPRRLRPPNRFPEVRGRDVAQKLVRHIERSQALPSILFHKNLANVFDKFCWEVQDAKGDLTAERKSDVQRSTVESR
jgi:hypothetical protein